MTLSPEELRARLATLEGVVVDCDGVLTEGLVTYDERGGRTLSFYARDGLGLGLLVRAGVRVAVVSGRPVDIAEHRHRELGVDPFVGSCRHKGSAVHEIAAGWGVAPERLAFVGDDLVDLAGFAACGLGVAVNDAAREVREAADWVTEAAGGRGAVREVCEAILKAKGAWDAILERLSR